MQVRVNEPYKLIDRGPVRSARTPQQISNIAQDSPESRKAAYGTMAAIERFWSGLAMTDTHCRR